MSVDADHKRLTKKKRSTAKGRFHRIYGRLLEGIQDELGTIVVEKILQDFETAYTELEARHEVFLETFDSESEEDKPKINELNHDLTGVDNDFEEMFRRLDMKYGRVEKLIDHILNELKRLNKVQEGDNMKFISLGETVEKCWLDLKRMNLEAEMNTATMEKSALEYMESDLREYGTAKGKINTFDANESENDENNNGVAVDPLQVQLQENQQVMKQVVEGLAQVAQAMSNKPTNRYNSDKYTDNHEIGDCSIFARLDRQTKVELVRTNGGCFSCLKIGHLSRHCHIRKPCDIQNELHQTCGKIHHKNLHTAHIDGISFHNSTQVVNDDKNKNGVLLMISSVQCKDKSLTTLWDPRANMSLITHKTAKRLGLSGQDITLSVTKVGNVTEHVQSKEYVIPLTDLRAEVARVDMSRVDQLFKGINKNDIQRPTGQVDILIGTDCCILMPNKEEQIGNLQLMRNQFGYCIRGSHPLLEVPKLSNHGIVRIYWASGKIIPLNDIHVLDRDSIKDKLDLLFDIEGPGKQTTLKCGSCKCGKCAIGQSQHSIREERELNIIKSGMIHDEESQQWLVNYPWIKNPNNLPNNVNSAVSRLGSTDKRLLRNSLEYASAYDEQIMDMVKHGIAKKLTKEEMEIHSGPVHYIPHHEVLKPESKSTPLRIVFNSSSSYMGHTLNDYWAKGSNVINDLLAVLIRFRQESIALAGDISKTYNAIRLSPLDQHTHRFVWRNLETHRDPDHYAFLTVTFGDRPSGAISTLVLHQTAKMYQHIYPDASKMVIRNSYVDDIIQSVESVDNARLITQQTEKMLACGGFRIKHWIISGNEKCGSTLQSQDSGESVEVDLDEFAHEKILGMRWDPKQDLFDFKVKINFSPKYKKKERRKYNEITD
ncbi:unnamed protein product [Mytilus coruscus]|uniref:CCHC-type domain-containing protein n=1 Tax=Mytilus coruscus TaxID=42192 RepID=A0A6J8AAA9_MYTCO|nr:unnamed protein product [Mytilus coruscus]